MEDARRRTREHVGDESIEVDYVRAGHLVDKRLGTIDVVTPIWVSARTGVETVSVAIEPRNDGRLATTMGTPERRLQVWVVREG